MSPTRQFQERMLVAAAKAWKFRPATLNGQPVEIPAQGAHHPDRNALKTHFLQPLLRRDAPRFRLMNARTGLDVATTLEPAFESASRKRGLLGRDDLPVGHALVIAPSEHGAHVFHAVFHRHPLRVAGRSRGQGVRAGARAADRRSASRLRGR